MRFLSLTTKDRRSEDECDHALLKNPKLRDIAMLHPFEMHEFLIASVNGYCVAGGRSRGGEPSGYDEGYRQGQEGAGSQ